MSVTNDIFRWVRALRSNEYRQTRNTLFREDEYDPDTDDYLPSGYCCLGVLGRVCGLEDDDLIDSSFIDSLIFYDDERHQKKLRATYVIDFLSGHESIFSAMNDEDELTFSQIADEIMRKYHNRQAARLQATV